MDDIESDWAYVDDPFDFIHARFLCVSIKDFGKLLKECYRYVIGTLSGFPPSEFLTENRSTKPGGWVEFQDLDGYPYSEDGSYKGTGLERYYTEVYGAFEMAGYEVRPGPKLEQWFKDAGFVNVHVEKFLIPHGVWPKDKHLVSLSCLFDSRKQEVLMSSYRSESAPGPRPGPNRTVSRA